VTEALKGSWSGSCVILCPQSEYLFQLPREISWTSGGIAQRKYFDQRWGSPARILESEANEVDQSKNSWQSEKWEPAARGPNISAHWGWLPMETARNPIKPSENQSHRISHSHYTPANINFN